MLAPIRKVEKYRKPKRKNTYKQNPPYPLYKTLMTNFFRSHMKKIIFIT